MIKKLQLSNKLPVYRQNEISECGIACLAMVMSYHGCNWDMSALRQVISVPITGANLKNIVEWARQFNFIGQALKVELGDLSKLRCPCILHWNLDHFVVLAKVKSHSVIIHDPAIGERELSMSEVSRYLTGVVLELQPASEFKPSKNKLRIQISQLWSKAIGLKRNLGLLIFFSVMLQMLGLMSSLYIQLAVDKVLPAENFQLLLVLGCAFIALLIYEVIVNYFRNFDNRQHRLCRKIFYFLAPLLIMLVFSHKKLIMSES